MSVDDNEKDTQEKTTTEEVENTEEVEEGSAEEQTEDKKPQYTEHEKKMFKNWKEAEAENKKLKAELQALKAKPQTSEKQDDGLSPMDTLALINAQITHKEDIEEVIKAAKLLGKSLSEAINDDLVKTRLSQIREYRKSAETSNTGGSKRSGGQMTEEALVAKARRGDELTEEEMRRFWRIGHPKPKR